MTDDKVTLAKEAALDKFRMSGPGHLNCSETVLSFGLAVLEGDPDLVLAAHYFGGGIARTGQMCGALTGAAISLGLRDYLQPGRNADATAPSIERLLELIRGFKAEFGAVACIELTGHDMSVPGGHDRAKEAGALERCPLFVSWVCDRVAPMFGDSAGH